MNSIMLRKGNRDSETRKFPGGPNILGDLKILGAPPRRLDDTMLTTSECIEEFQIHNDLQQACACWCCIAQSYLSKFWNIFHGPAYLEP